VLHEKTSVNAFDPVSEAWIVMLPEPSFFHQPGPVSKWARESVLFHCTLIAEFVWLWTWIVTPQPGPAAAGSAVATPRRWLRPRW
jgi:hypothetical protein